MTVRRKPPLFSDPKPVDFDSIGKKGAATSSDAGGFACEATVCLAGRH
jgi:hypothetical protein